MKGLYRGYTGVRKDTCSGDVTQCSCEFGADQRNKLHHHVPAVDVILILLFS